MSRNILSSLLSLVALFAILGLMSPPVDLECKRAERGGPVNCTKWTRLLWIIPFSEQRINNVRSARVSESIDYEGDSAYRVELLTAGSMVPLRSVYISGTSAQEGVADQINDFVGSAVPGMLAMTEPGLLSLDNLFYGLIFFIIAEFGGLLWSTMSRL